MHQAQRAQGLDQLQFAIIEFAKGLVAGQDVSELPPHLFRIAREQHPQILYRRPHAGIIEIDEVRAILRP